MVMDSLSLDIDELNHQAEIESLMPAMLVESEMKEIIFERNGIAGSRMAWQLRWDRLDQDTTGASGEKYLFQSSHNQPAEGQLRRSTLKKQVDCFAKLKLTGKNPEDFLGVRHWIREIVENAGTQYEKAWWRSEALYIEGQTYEQAINGESVDINPPSSSNSMVEPTDEVEMDPSVEGSPYDLLLEAIHGKTHRTATTAVRNDGSIPEELKDQWNTGTLVEGLIEQGFLEEVDGKYNRLNPVSE